MRPCLRNSSRSDNTVLSVGSSESLANNKPPCFGPYYFFPRNLRVSVHTKADPGPTSATKSQNKIFHPRVHTHRREVALFLRIELRPRRSTSGFFGRR